jgi:hypothetical protein
LFVVGINALFSFDVDGDSGVDPNAMTLWFSQPDLGLPSKVCVFDMTYFEIRFVDLHGRNIMTMQRFARPIKMLLNDFWPHLLTRSKM